MSKRTPTALPSEDALIAEGRAVAERIAELQETAASLSLDSYTDPQIAAKLREAEAQITAAEHDQRRVQAALVELRRRRAIAEAQQRREERERRLAELRTLEQQRDAAKAAAEEALRATGTVVRAYFDTEQQVYQSMAALDRSPSSWPFRTAFREAWINFHLGVGFVPTDLRRAFLQPTAPAKPADVDDGAIAVQQAAAGEARDTAELVVHATTSVPLDDDDDDEAEPLLPDPDPSHPASLGVEVRAFPGQNRGV
ncbi:MAG: hypothetical protein AB7R89_28790 [Dehalococcoidia bacterium]